MYELDLSKPLQRVLSVKLKGDKTLDFTLKRIKIKDAKAHAGKVKKLTDALSMNEVDGLTFSYEMLKLTCEPFNETLAGQLDDEQLTAIWRKVRELKEEPAPETTEKKS
jgi:hypothetical protein